MTQETLGVGFDDLSDLLMAAQVAGLGEASPLLAAWLRLSQAWHAKAGVAMPGSDSIPANPYVSLPEGAERLSERDRTILAFITESVAERGYPPSLREIGAHFGLSSSSTVKLCVDRLERRGWLVRDHSRPRAIRVVQPTEGA